MQRGMPFLLSQDTKTTITDPTDSPCPPSPQAPVAGKPEDEGGSGGEDGTGEGASLELLRAAPALVWDPSASREAEFWG